MLGREGMEIPPHTIHTQHNRSAVLSEYYSLRQYHNVFQCCGGVSFRLFVSGHSGPRYGFRSNGGPMSFAPIGAVLPVRCDKGCHCLRVRRVSVLCEITVITFYISDYNKKYITSYTVT